MQKFKPAAVLLTVVALVAVFGLLSIGAMLPREHRVSRSINVAAPQADVWAVIEDIDHIHDWLPELSPLDRLTDQDGLRVYEGMQGREPLTLTITEEEPTDRLVAKFEWVSNAQGAVWTLELASSELGTEVSLTEEGFIQAPPVRLYKTMTDGHEQALDLVLQSLKAHIEG